MTMAFTGKVGGVQYTGFGTMLFNTVFLSVVSLVVMVAVALLAGYAMGTRQFKGKGVVHHFPADDSDRPFLRVYHADVPVCRQAGADQ